MKLKKTVVFFIIILAIILPPSLCSAKKRALNALPISSSVWTNQRANTWYKDQPWLSGCNFQPSSAINQIEMWQAESFDPVTIDKELGWAE